jgi:hypothetical protein
MTIRFGVAAAAAMSLIVPTTATASDCATPAKAKVLDRSAVTVVYATKTRIYGCHDGHKRMTLTEILPQVTREFRGAVNGRFVAVADSAVTHYGCEETYAQSFDLVRRRRIAEALLGRTDCSEAVGAFRLGGLAVGNRGSLAAMLIVRGVPHVMRVRRGATTAVTLDHGDQIVARSLRLRDSTLSWRRADQNRTATLR